MLELWYGIVAVMLTAYVVLDGYDLGSGALHLFLARGDRERRQVLAAIGPYWDANEVWLLATGGALFVGFPRVLASGLSGFYFAIFLVLWCLILRGISVEFRSHVSDRHWRAFWDVGFGIASILLAVFFGAALGNLIRGLPLNAEGWFGLTLFTDFTARPPVGILDWYTVSAGVFALLVLAWHGANWLSWKTDGAVHERAESFGTWLTRLVTLLWPLMTWATASVNADLFRNFPGRPIAWIGLILALFGMLLAWRRKPAGGVGPFLGSCAFITGLMVGTAACVWPVMLRAVPDAAASVTAHTGGNDAAGLSVAIRWWMLGFPIAIAYFVVLFRLHRGKARAAADGEGY
ncbi:MAG TPA: cytochrome d ubiquinol oxidase subunit II [Candidatus Eisenbacteria bacterium]